ncbi:MAG: 4-hydroxy-tetrahydrodipicolinate synthase [Bacteroidales bacterium]|nr:4-hydroxy-tetrahydrodipicolinate synthase [Bacteroidales bacterium]
MQSNSIVGTGVALVTPFNSRLEVDYQSLERLIEYVIGNGANFLVLFGTTGEPVTLIEEEKIKIIEFVCNKVNKRLPLVLGHGGNNTMAVVKSLATASYISKFDAILSVSPYYNKPSQEGIFQHYKAIAEASPIPVIVYNVPGRTSSNIEVGTAVRLAENCKNIIGLKEASPSVEQFTYMKKSLPANFLLFSGDDSLLLPHLSLGAAGAISVTANAMPKIYSSIINDVKKVTTVQLLKNHLRLIEFTDSLFEEGSPAGIKAALSVLGICEGFVRLPLIPVSDSLKRKITDLLNGLK